MKGRPSILRIAGFVLLLIFSQKTGIGLTLHNLFHTGTYSAQLPSKQESNDKELSLACSCIDDFLMPFTPADEPLIQTPVSAPVFQFGVVLADIPFHYQPHSSLRGPPSIG